MTINYDRILPEHLNCLMTQENLTTIKEFAKDEREILQRKENESTSKSRYVKCYTPKRLLTPQKAEEIAYSSARYSNLSKTERNILAANIALTDEKFIEILRNTNLLDFEYLNHYIKLVNYFRNKQNKKLNPEESVVKSYVIKYTNALIKRFASYIGPTRPEIIINKINEILSFNPEILCTAKYTK